MNITSEELKDIGTMAQALSCENVIEVLEILIQRERKLVEMCEKPEEREIAIHNLTALAAAVSRLTAGLPEQMTTQDQTSLPK